MRQRRFDPARRRALAGLLGLGAAAAFGHAAAAVSPALRTRPVPVSGEPLPVVGLGTYATFDVGAEGAARERLAEVLGGFVRLGGTLIDSSPMYGSSETVIGDLRARLGLRERLFLATKVWTTGREAGIRQMEQSFARMRTPVMDLMQVHNLLDWRTQLATLRRWREEGRIRYIGITHYVPDAFPDMARIMRSEWPDFVQLPYSLATREAETSLLPLAAELGTAVLVNRPFEKGALFRRVRGRTLPGWAADFDCRSWAQFFLKYILAEPAVTCVIPATGKPRHLADNMAAGRGALPDAAQRRRMRAVLEGV